MTNSIKDLKKGDFFTIRKILYPSESQVYIKGQYVREIKKYSCTNFNDTNKELFLDGNKNVYIDFIF
jgi:hypothetical protein